MKYHEWDTLNDILNDLEYEGFEGFYYDCLAHGAAKTAKYIQDCISGVIFNRDIARMILADDFAGA